jgi:carboxyl-terminal processing protease
MKIGKEIRVAILAVILAGSLLLLMLSRDRTVRAETDAYEELKVFTEVLSTLQKHYVEPVDMKALSRGAIKGMLNTLDAHSSFMPPEIYKEMQVDTKGEFGGLGIQIGIKGGRLVVIAPIEGTPADKAGIKAGDAIVKVDDYTFTKESSLMEAVGKMRGPEGTSVTLTVQREQATLSFKLVREIIHIQSVKSKLLEAGIGYVRLTQFQEQTAADMLTALSKLREENIHSLILDLRNNPGGLLTSAVDVSEAFLPQGQMIVSIRGRDTKQDEYRSKSSGVSKDIPMIVLVNEGSASASEIVSGALQDWGRAVVVGMPTFGKGSVQTILPLSDGSALRLTTAKYYTPKGRSIQNTGIEPDILVKSAETKEAKTILREKDLERHLKNDTISDLPKADPVVAPPLPSETPSSTTTEPPADESVEAEDIQLEKAVDLLKSWRIFKGLGPVQAVQRTIQE